MTTLSEQCASQNSPAVSSVPACVPGISRLDIKSFRQWVVNVIQYCYNYMRYGMSGRHVKIDACSLCQLRCVLCPRDGVARGAIGLGYLKFSDFKRFIDAHPTIRFMELSGWGEIFLNPELKDIIRYAQQKLVYLTAKNGANLNDLDDETAEALVRYKFRELVISMDGATEETYRVYRRGGDLNKVIGNVRKINTYKKRYHRRLPILVWQFIPFGFNEHEINAAREMARSLDMEFVLKNNWDPLYAPVKDAERVMRTIRETVLTEYGKTYHKVYPYPCSELWMSPQINWDGAFLGCGINMFASLGNVFREGLRKCIKGSACSTVLRMTSGVSSDSKTAPCAACGVFHAMKRDGSYFDKLAGSKAFIKRFPLGPFRRRP